MNVHKWMLRVRKLAEGGNLFTDKAHVSLEHFPQQPGDAKWIASVKSLGGAGISTTGSDPEVCMATLVELLLTKIHEQASALRDALVKLRAVTDSEER